MKSLTLGSGTRNRITLINCNDGSITLEITNPREGTHEVKCLDRDQVEALNLWTTNFLAENPKKQHKWLNLYPHNEGVCHDSKEKADDNASSRRLACIEVEFTEGEGL